MTTQSRSINDFIKLSHLLPFLLHHNDELFTKLPFIMHFLLFLLVAGAVGFASAKTINIAAADYTFTPGTSTADKGDILNFHFYPHQHNVVQGVFNKPCTPLANGFFSGTIAAPSGPANATFSVEVKDDQPIWFYCSVGKHCQRGMVGVINAPYVTRRSQLFL